MTRLSIEDWNKLDGLLAKHGFGGYYDMLERLKMVLSRLIAKDIDLSEVKDLYTAVRLLMTATGPKEKKTQ